MVIDGRCYLCRRGQALPGETCPRCGTEQPPAILNDNRPTASADAVGALLIGAWNNAIETAAKWLETADDRPHDGETIAERIRELKK